MKYGAIHALVGGVPFISRRNAEFLYRFIVERRLTRILELGIAHGTATCYMAAALEELGGGSITAVDLLAVRDHFQPSAEEQLEKTQLARFVDVHRMETGYTWFLHDEIARNTVGDVCQEIYDLCIIDGPKNWTIDGAAFFFVDKLLKRDGWIIFDDYRWTYAEADGRREATDGITHRSLSQAERETPHIREVFELLVKQHPHYGNFLRIEAGDWALAQKTASPAKTYQIQYRAKRSLLDRLRRRPRLRP